MLKLNPTTRRLEMGIDPKFIEREINPVSLDPATEVLNTLLAEKKVYIVKLNRAGTAAPTATILKDTLTAAVWARTAPGVYTLTKTGAFPIIKTVPEKDIYSDPAGNILKLTRTSADVMTLQTYAAANTELLADVDLINQDLTIEIYN